jgi:hypothetical protein
MLKFEISEDYLPNEQLINTFKQYGYKYTVNKGMIKKCLHTNIQFVMPIIYTITYPTKLIIYEYKVNEISNKHFYIPNNKQKYNLKEIKQVLSKL